MWDHLQLCCPVSPIPSSFNPPLPFMNTFSTWAGFFRNVWSCLPSPLPRRGEFVAKRLRPPLVWGRGRVDPKMSIQASLPLGIKSTRITPEPSQTQVLSLLSFMVSYGKHSQPKPLTLGKAEIRKRSVLHPASCIHPPPAIHPPSIPPSSIPILHPDPHPPSSPLPLGQLQLSSPSKAWLLFIKHKLCLHTAPKLLSTRLEQPGIFWSGLGKPP